MDRRYDDTETAEDGGATGACSYGLYRYGPTVAGLLGYIVMAYIVMAKDSGSTGLYSYVMNLGWQVYWVI